MRFAMASWVRNPDDLLEFAAEFGLSRFDVSQGPRSPVVPVGLLQGMGGPGFSLPENAELYRDGVPVGLSVPEFEAGLNCADLREVYTVLRTEAQIRRGMAARNANTSELPAVEAPARATPRADIL
jgi:hypothetical protein